jgi:glycerol-3-phosphate dehydrogenase subunit C
MGNKAADMMKLVPEAKVTQILRCSGHGGSWGVMKGNFQTALKVGRPAFRQAAQLHKQAVDAAEKDGRNDPQVTTYLSSECPLAGQHLRQGIERLDLAGKPEVVETPHPIELFARAYGLEY